MFWLNVLEADMPPTARIVACVMAIVVIFSLCSSPKSPTNTFSFAETNSPPDAGPLKAVEISSNLTQYTVQASDRDKDMLYFSWTNSTICGSFYANGDKAIWTHPSPPCPAVAFLPGTFTVIISDVAGNNITRVYNGGSASGEGTVPALDLPSAQTANPSLTASPEVIMLAVGGIIFLGVGGEYFFRKTGIPDIAFLMILGVILGPILGVVTTPTVVKVVPYFAALALIIIMFDGGMNLNIKNVIATARFSLVLATAGFFAASAVTAIIAVFTLGWTWSDGILLGSMVGGSSSIVVFGVVRRLTITEDTKSMLSLESAITDILATVVVFVLLQVVVSGHVGADAIAAVATRSILTGLLLGFGVGIPWLYVYSKLSNASHVTMLTLGMLFVLYFLAKEFGESGALTSLVFGMMLGNRQFFVRKLRLKLNGGMTSQDPFQERITFLVRSFFFVFVGLLASFSKIDYIIIGVGIGVALFATRYLVARFSVKDERFPVFDKIITVFMMPRGLAAAVLATLPLTLGLPNATAYPQIVFVIILSSVLITTAGLIKYRKQADSPSAISTSIHQVDK